MVTLFVRHSVSDYQAWRKVYDDFFETRKQAGVTGGLIGPETALPFDLGSPFGCRYIRLFLDLLGKTGDTANINVVERSSN